MSQFLTPETTPVLIQFEEVEGQDVVIEVTKNPLESEKGEENHSMKDKVKEVFDDTGRKILSISLKPIITVGTALIKNINAMEAEAQPAEVEANFSFDISTTFGLYLVTEAEARGSINVKMTWKNK